MDPVVLLEAHSGLRWLLIAVTVFALIVALRAMRGGGGMLNRIAMLLFRIVITLQWLVGVLLLVVKYPIGEWPGRLEHILIMTVAMALTHIFGGRRAARPLVSLLLIVVVLALVIFGIVRVEQAGIPVAAA